GLFLLPKVENRYRLSRKLSLSLSLFPSLTSLSCVLGPSASSNSIRSHFSSAGSALAHWIKEADLPNFVEFTPFRERDKAWTLSNTANYASCSLSSSEGKSRRRRKDSKVDNMSKVVPPPPPPRRTVPSRMQKFIWSLTPKEALVYAKKEVEHAPAVMEDDPDLYAPIFRNISVFKRSYELMELILKVYIYRDGARPIFHQPHLRGIYASEGWFMKLMEENRQFYAPIGMALYVPNSHNLKPLSIFLRDYTNTIAAKYPFWNRTHGSDHFLVACHDWGPYTLTAHEELTKNTIKALCNADTSEGIFVARKDVSLPETTIRTPRKPLRNVGGFRVSQRPLLAFFAGNMHGRVRRHFSSTGRTNMKT
ncbi:Exostosin family protein, partial [Prunus dulcis]